MSLKITIITLMTSFTSSMRIKKSLSISEVSREIIVGESLRVEGKRCETGNTTSETAEIHPTRASKDFCAEIILKITKKQINPRSPSKGSTLSTSMKIKKLKEFIKIMEERKIEVKRIVKAIEEIDNKERQAKSKTPGIAI